MNTNKQNVGKKSNSYCIISFLFFRMIINLEITIDSSYNSIKGKATSVKVNGSVVGVITAAKIHIKTIAYFLLLIKKEGETMPIRVSIIIMIGISNVIPIAIVNRIAKLKYFDALIMLSMPIGVKLKRTLTDNGNK